MRKIEYNISFYKMVDDEVWAKVKAASDDDSVRFSELVDVVKKEFDIDIPTNGELTCVYDDSDKDNVIFEM